MLHDFDPFAIQLTENFGLRWYGLSYMAGFIIAFWIIHWMAKTGRSLLQPTQVADFITYVAIGILAGGRLGYCLFYSPDLFFDFSSEFPFWGVLSLNKGGMASHGGLIGIVASAWLFGRKHKVDTLHLFDLVTITGPIGVFFGRIANFINGELVGRPAPEGYSWAVKFPQDIFVWARYEFERLKTLVPAVEELGVSKEQWLSWLSGYRQNWQNQLNVHETLDKIINAVQLGDESIQAALAPALTARYPSQLYGAIFEGLFIFIILAVIWYRPRRQGVIAGSFLMLYPVMRIFTEQYRMPDPHIGFELFALTRGQWLSLVMFVIGATAFFWWRKVAPPTPVGGWKKPQKS